MDKNNISARIFVNSKPVQEFNHNNRTFIEGRIGTEYSIHITNHWYQKVLAVVTVDGINVITGEPDNTEECGYIINGYNSLDIKGFRKDLNTVGAFKFCQQSKSYCNEKGLPGNNGVIGVKIFSERTKPPIVYNTEDLKGYYMRGKRTLLDHDSSWVPSSTCKTKKRDNNEIIFTNVNSNVYDNGNVNDTFGSTCNISSINEESSSISNSAFGIGTTWGEQVQSVVENTTFDKGSIVAEFEIYYASIKGLQKLGVPMKKIDHITYPKAFNNFAIPPKGWKG